MFDLKPKIEPKIKIDVEGWIRRAVPSVAAMIIAIVVGTIILLTVGGFLFTYIKSDVKAVFEDQLQNRNERIAKLESENSDLIAEVARLDASQAGGEAVQERRKALAEKEASLKSKEGQLSRREERIRLAEEKIEKQQKEFYEKTGLTMKEIGAAEQIKEDYENMRISRDRAEDRANNWLIYFSIILFMFVILVVASVTFLMYMAAKNRRVEYSIRILDSINLNTQDKNLLISSPGGPPIEHPGKNGDEADKKESGIDT